MAEAINYLDVQTNTSGGIVGPKIIADISVPAGYGVIWQTSDGKWWKQRLAQNEDATTYYDENGRPQIEIVQVTP